MGSYATWDCFCCISYLAAVGKRVAGVADVSVRTGPAYYAPRALVLLHIVLLFVNGLRLDN